VKSGKIVCLKKIGLLVYLFVIIPINNGCLKLIPVAERAQALDARGNRQPERGRAVDDDVPLAVPQCKVEARSTPPAKDQSV